MKVFVVRAVLCASAVAVTTAAHAQSTFHVRPAASGARDGSDWVNAFDRLPASLVRGATYYLADGAYPGALTFNTPPSGTLAITIKKATQAAHGTDIGWDPSFGDGVAEFQGTWTFTTGSWDIDGVTGGGPGTSTSAWPGTWTTAHGISQTVGPFESNIDLNTSANVRGLRFRHLKLVNGTPSDNTTARYGNVFHAEFGATPRASDVTVEYVFVPDFQGVPFHVKEAHDWTIQFSHFAGNGVSNVQVHRELWSGIGNDRWTWRWNYIRNIVNSAVWALVNGGGVTDGVEIYGNVVDYSDDRTSAGVLIDASDSGAEPVLPTNWKVYNNTVVGWRQEGPLVWLGAGSANEFCNNLYANMQTAYGPQVSVTTKSHNAAFNIIRLPPWAGDETAAWATAMGNASQIFTSDPFLDYSQRRLSLRGPTQSGTSSGSPAGNQRDMFGIQRGADGVWDRGALEYSPATTTPAPATPAGLTVR